MTDFAADDTVEFWCRGARRRSTRALDPAERRWVRRLRAAHLRHVAAGLAIVPLALLVPLAVFTWVPLPAGDLAAVVIGLWGFTTFLIGLPVAILVVADHGRAVRDLGADLAADEVWIFEPPDPGLAGAGEDETVAGVDSFALLPYACRPVNLADRTTDPSREEVLEVDPHTGTEFEAPLSLRVTTPVPDVRFTQRPLSPLERRELARVRRDLFRPRWSTALAFFVVAFLVGLGRFLAEGHGTGGPPGWSDLLSAALALLICVRALVRYTRSLLLAGRMGRDLETGLVVRIAEPGAPRSEMLPFSRLAWRVAGAPAMWRDRRRAAQTLREHL